MEILRLLERCLPVNICHFYAAVIFWSPYFKSEEGLNSRSVRLTSVGLSPRMQFIVLLTACAAKRGLEVVLNPWPGQTEVTTDWLGLLYSFMTNLLITTMKTSSFDKAVTLSERPRWSITTGFSIWSDSWVGLTLIGDVPPSCPLAQPVPAQEEPGRWWNSPNQSQPNPGDRPPVPPCTVIQTSVVSTGFHWVANATLRMRGCMSTKAANWDGIRSDWFAWMTMLWFQPEVLAGVLLKSEIPLVRL